MLADILLVLNIIVAVLLVLVILVQRAEGGMGALGGEGSGSVMGGVSSQTPLTKITVALTIVFFASSLWLAVETAGDARATSVLDTVTETPVDNTPVVPMALPSTDGTAAEVQ